MPRVNRTLRTTKQRGYSGDHPRLRAQWKPLADAGLVNCHAAICLEERDGHTRLIRPGTPWHLGHTPDRSAWTGPEHQRCNTADGARRKNTKRLPSPARWLTSRQW